MLRKTILSLELAVIGCFLVGAAYVYAHRLEKSPALVYRGSPLAPPAPTAADTPRRFSPGARRLFDSLMREREKRGGQLNPRAQRLFDSTMLAESHPGSLPPNTTGMEWHATVSPPQHNPPTPRKTKIKPNGNRP